MLQTYLKDPTWYRRLKDEFEKPYWVSLETFLNKKYEGKKAVYPPKDKIFEAFNLTPLNEIKAVILGQDPYHQPGQAMGLSFSVQEGVPFPPSLKNILKEFSECFKTSAPRNGNLTPWANEGVLLLNAVLTVDEGKANSHEQKGWETFTDRVIQMFKKNRESLLFFGGAMHRKKQDSLTKRNTS